MRRSLFDAAAMALEFFCAPHLEGSASRTLLEVTVSECLPAQ
jgi:hypothetical protein